MIAAKSYTALRDMNEIIRTDLLKKEYYHHGGYPAVRAVHRMVGARREEQQGEHPCTQSQDERRKQIITDVDVLRTAGRSLCKIGLVTGRTTRSVHIWPIWAVRFWATSSTATAR